MTTSFFITISLFLVADIRQQGAVLANKNATAAQVDKAAERLLFYGEASYWHLKDRMVGIGEKRCRQLVWPRVLAPRTKLLIADLGSDKFAIRQRATDQLLEIGPYNRIMILQAVGQTKDLEVLMRLNQLIEAMPLYP